MSDVWGSHYGMSHLEVVALMGRHSMGCRTYGVALLGVALKGVRLVGCPLVRRRT